MKKTLFQVVAAVLVVSMLVFSAGCYGSFNLTKKVYHFNGGVGGKWVNELVFLALLIVPVYSIAAFVDAVVLNSIEFWTGSNPVSAAGTSKQLATQNTTVSFNDADRSMLITQNVPGKGLVTYKLVHEDGKTLVKNAEGKILVQCSAAQDGSMTLTDANGNVLTHYTMAEVEALALNR